jgi:transmembrane sensor
MRTLSSWFRRRPRNASEWLARTRSDSAGEDDDRELTEWLARKPANERDYEVAEIVWHLSGELKGDPQIDQLTLPTRRRATVFIRVAAAVVIAGTAFALLYFAATFKAQFGATYTTAMGQQRSIVLPDDTRVFLNTATVARVEYTARRRSIWLEAGEATFDAARNPWRPFEVHTAMGTALALGTRFDVFIRPSSLEVTIIEGRVAVRAAGRAGEGEPTVVHTGQLATIDRSAHVSVRHAELDRILSQQIQRLEFDGTSVAEAIAEFNRYSERPIVASTPEIAALRISGVFRAGDTETFVRSLEVSLSVRAINRDGTLVLVPGNDRAAAQVIE